MRYTPEGAVMTDIVLELFKLSGLLIQAGDRLGTEFGLTSARWKVLGALANASHPMTVPMIARSMGQTRQAVQRLANEMLTDGLLRIEKNPDHKRANFLVLTAAGQAAFDAVMSRQVPWANALANEIALDDLQTTASVLQSMVSSLER
jgi:DNA-binding MarR family transcriptional regulator